MRCPVGEGEGCPDRPAVCDRQRCARPVDERRRASSSIATARRPIPRSLAVLPALVVVEPTSELLAGKRASISARVSPCHEPTSTSRRCVDGDGLEPVLGRHDSPPFRLRVAAGSSRPLRAATPSSSAASSARLRASGFVQRRVGMPLKAALAVPVGLAVAGQQDRRHGRTRLAARWTSACASDVLCLVTGSTGGIGRATARAARRAEGARVDHMRSRRGARCRGGDCTSAPTSRSRGEPERVASAEARPARRARKQRRLRGAARLPDAVTDEQWDEVWQLNVMSYVRAIGAAVPGMRERGGGAIVNVVSRRPASVPRPAMPRLLA